MDTDTVQRLEYLLKENACSGVELASGWLQILFGDRRLVIQCAWRLVQNGEIMLASDDTEAAQSNEIALTLLHHKRVRGVSIAPPFHDIEVRFENDAVLQGYTDSKKFENWLLFGGPQERIVAGPGTLWSRWEP